jgi:hypothetical protein
MKNAGKHDLSLKTYQESLAILKKVWEKSHPTIYLH